MTSTDQSRRMHSDWLSAHPVYLGHLVPPSAALVSAHQLRGGALLRGAAQSARGSGISGTATRREEGRKHVISPVIPPLPRPQQLSSPLAGCATCWRPRPPRCPRKSWTPARCSSGRRCRSPWPSPAPGALPWSGR